MSASKYVPPHLRRQLAASKDTAIEEFTSTDNNHHHHDPCAQVLQQALSRVCCINLARRTDRWETFRRRMEEGLGRRGRIFFDKVERFEAVDGSSLWFEDDDEHDGSGDHHHDVTHPRENKMHIDPNVVQITWDATNNARYDKHIQPPMIKRLSPGEVGCAMSHVQLWQQWASDCDNNDNDDKQQSSAMLILEDDAVFYQKKQQSRQQHRDEDGGFVDAFATAWKQLPATWDILYLGFSDRGERHYLLPGAGRDNNPEQRNNSTKVVLFQPTYGFHTHAYILTKRAAAMLLSHLPVVGPLDVWLADNAWFGLKVYCAIVPGEGWQGRGPSLMSQQRHDTASDIAQSGRRRRRNNK